MNTQKCGREFRKVLEYNPTIETANIIVREIRNLTKKNGEPLSHEDINRILNAMSFSSFYLHESDNSQLLKLISLIKQELDSKNNSEDERGKKS